MNVKLSGGLGYIQAVLKELVDGNQSLLVEIIRGLAAEDLLNEHLAQTILDTLGLEKENTTHIAYGTIVSELKEVSRSYKEARMALDVGKIFSPEKDVIAYSSLGIGRLIYQLPIPLCKMCSILFLKS